MTKSQLATMRALLVVGLLVLGAGIVLYLVDQSAELPRTCVRVDWVQACRQEEPSARGGWVAAVGALITIGTIVAWSTLPGEARPKREPVPGKKQRPAWFGLAVALGVLWGVGLVVAVVMVYVL